MRNLHAESEDELQVILHKIFDNFAKKRTPLPSPKEKKTEKSQTTIKLPVAEDKVVCVQQGNQSHGTNVPRKSTEETIKSAAVVRNIATSVIKFVGRSHDSQMPQKEMESTNESNSISQQFNIITPASIQPEPVSTAHKSQPAIQAGINELDPEIGVNLPSLEPLCFDQFPAIAPLPLLSTNSNLNVYRQLLSPYLRKPTESSSAGSNVTSIDSEKGGNKNFKLGSATAVVIDRPPKKMIEKYEIYRN